MDRLKFARQKTAYCYFSAASFLSAPELSDARLSWAKSSILTTVIDDFFDVGGSMDELVNFVQILEKYIYIYSIKYLYNFKIIFIYNYSI